jgi:uncharacterized Tic20 family protein
MKAPLYGQSEAVIFTPNQEEKNFAVIMHLSPLLGILFPLIGFIVPVVIWYFKKDRSPYIDDRGKEVFNFMISAFLAVLIFTLLFFVMLGIFLMYAFTLYTAVVSVVAAFKTSRGDDYRYPFIIRLIK